MMRFLFIGLLLVVSSYFLLQSKEQYKSTEVPVFLKKDHIAREHQTEVAIKVLAPIKPDSIELNKLKKDYSNLWAHLNHLYATNDIKSGKEYYTEEMFRQYATHYDEPLKPIVKRKDIKHELNIINWSEDGLLCTVVDSNLVLQYEYQDKSIKTSQATIAMVLLFQGDHWRMDAIRVLSEKENSIN